MRSVFLKSAFPIMSHSQDLTMSLGKMGYTLRNRDRETQRVKERHVWEVEPIDLAEALWSWNSSPSWGPHTPFGLGP